VRVRKGKVAVATACGEGKRAGTLPALELYTGSRIKAVYNRSCDQPMFVLSSEYGLIPVEKEIACYNRIMDEKRAKELAPQVAQVLKNIEWLIYYRTGARKDYTDCIRQAASMSGTNLVLIGPRGRYLKRLDAIAKAIKAITSGEISALSEEPDLEIVASEINPVLSPNVVKDVTEFRKWQEIPGILIERGGELLAQPRSRIDFSRNIGADNLLNDLDNYPHAFVLACVMDRQMRAERAWLIPYEVSKELDGFEFRKLLLLDVNAIKEIFKRKSLHRFNEVMAHNFYLALQRIHTEYHDDASNIWKGNPKSATIVRRFLQFHGVGIKIASMAANILARDFKIPMADKLCIDISPDIQVRRVFIRLGLIDKNATNEELIYRARELNPEYPGIFDVSVWEIGRKWCRPRNPKCTECYLESRCLRIME